MLRIPLAVELQDHVDDMLEHLRSGQAALLRNMAHEEHGDALFFRHALEHCRSLAHLSQTARQPVDISRSHGLNGIDDHKLRADPLDLVQDVRDVRLARDENALRQRFESLCAQPDLSGRFFARDVQNRTVHFGIAVGHLQEKRRLADAGLAAEQHDRARQNAPAQHPVEFGKVNRPAGPRVGGHMG